MKTKIENWNGRSIRFVEKKPGDWWAVAADVAKALNLDNTTKVIKRIEGENQANIPSPLRKVATASLITISISYAMQ